MSGKFLKENVRSEACGLGSKLLLGVRFSSTSTVATVKLDNFCLKLFKEGTVNQQLAVS